MASATRSIRSAGWMLSRRPAQSLALLRHLRDACPVTDDILALQRAFDDAELRGDAGRLRELRADDFQSIGELGYQLGKGEWIARHGEFRYLAVETTEVDLRR